MLSRLYKLTQMRVSTDLVASTFPSSRMGVAQERSTVGCALGAIAPTSVSSALTSALAKRNPPLPQTDRAQLSSADMAYYANSLNPPIKRRASVDGGGFDTGK